MGVKLGVHHLEDLVTEAGTVIRTALAAAFTKGVTKPAAKVYLKWVITHSSFLRTLRATPEPLWTSGLDVWEPTISETPSVTVVGGRGAKREKVQIGPVGDSLQEVGEDLLDSLGAVAANLPRICALDAGGPPILDIRLHKALTYFLEIRTHYGAPLWAGVDRDVEGVDLHAWDEPALSGSQGRPRPQLLASDFGHAQGYVDHQSCRRSHRPVGGP